MLPFRPCELSINLIRNPNAVINDEETLPGGNGKGTRGREQCLGKKPGKLYKAQVQAWGQEGQPASREDLFKGVVGSDGAEERGAGGSRSVKAR